MDVRDNTLLSNVRRLARIGEPKLRRDLEGKTFTNDMYEILHTVSMESIIPEDLYAVIKRYAKLIMRKQPQYVLDFISNNTTFVDDANLYCKMFYHINKTHPELMDEFYVNYDPDIANSRCIDRYYREWNRRNAVQGLHQYTRLPSDIINKISTFSFSKRKSPKRSRKRSRKRSHKRSRRRRSRSR